MPTYSELVKRYQDAAYAQSEFADRRARTIDYLSNEFARSMGGGRNTLATFDERQGEIRCRLVIPRGGMLDEDTLEVGFTLERGENDEVVARLGERPFPMGIDMERADFYTALSEAFAQAIATKFRSR